MSLILQVLRTLGWENVELRVKRTEDSTGTVSAKGPQSRGSTNWALTDWQDRPRLCSLVAVLQENITVRHSRGRILIFIVLLMKKNRALLRYLLPTEQAVPPSQTLKGRSQAGRGGHARKSNPRSSGDAVEGGKGHQQSRLKRVTGVLSQPQVTHTTTLPNSHSDKWHKEVLPVLQNWEKRNKSKRI